MIHVKMQAPLKKKKSMYLPIDAYFTLDICMFNAIKLLYCVVLYCIVYYLFSFYAEENKLSWLLNNRNEPQREIIDRMACAPSEDSNRSVDPCSLTGVNPRIPGIFG